MPRPRRTKVAASKVQKPSSPVENNTKTSTPAQTTRRTRQKPQTQSVTSSPKQASRVTKVTKPRSSTRTRNVSTPQPKLQTPEPAANSESDSLYGLSPSGEISRAKIEAQHQQSEQRTRLMQPQSAIKAVSTPAIENSILALTKFKRRARQPSIIRLIQDATDAEDNDDSLANWNLDDFQPEGEGTPLTTNGDAIEKRLIESSGQKRNSLGKRKRGSSQVAVVRSQTPLSELASPPSSPLPEPQETIELPDEQQEESQSEVNAPPLSSSPISSPEQPIRSTKGMGDNTKRRRKAIQVSTTILESFMPKTRRAKRARKDAIVEISDSSNTDSEESEEDAPSSPPRARARRSTVISKATNTGRKALAEKKAAQTTTLSIKTPLQKGKTRAKYGRHGQEDKENADNSFMPDVQPDESSVLEDLHKANELSKMKSKFAEIDDWEMEFETVDMGDTSSPWR